MNKLNLIFFILFAGLIQTISKNIKADLLFITVLLISLNTKRKNAILWSVLCGIIKDALSIGPFGINVVFFSLWAFLIATISKYLYKTYLFTVFSLFIVGFIIKYLLFIILHLMKGYIDMNFLIIFWNDLIFNCLFLFLITWIFRRCVLRYSR